LVGHIVRPKLVLIGHFGKLFGHIFTSYVWWPTKTQIHHLVLPWPFVMPLCLVCMPIWNYLHVQTELVPVVSVIYMY